jgi:CRISPR-associated endonuclease Cas3-HD
MLPLFSSPDETYIDHIALVEETTNSILPVYESTLKRVLDWGEEDGLLREAFSKMATFHDLGKLTKRWQENVGKGSKLPSHASIGAAYLWKTLPAGLKEPISFAVAIHHTDKGLLGDNIERPDVQAITDGIVDSDGFIVWAKDVNLLSQRYFPKEASTLCVDDLKDMARGLRVWARGCPFMEQHKRRIQAALAHHIIKLCDVSAAKARKEYKKQSNQDYYGGWLMVETISRYVSAIHKRLGYEG